MAAKSLVDSFLRRGLNILITVFTKSGYFKAQELWGEKITITRFPLDSYYHLGKILNLAKPKIFVNMETELWPNLLQIMKNNGVVSFLVNGRISDKNFKRVKLLRGTFSRLVRVFERIYAQTEKDRDRFIFLGADPSKVVVTGNIKIDSFDTEENTYSRDLLGISENDFVITFASLREKEESTAVWVSEEILASRNDVTIIFAPRHLNRVKDIIVELESRGINYSLWSRGEKNGKLLIVDVLGQLRRFFPLSDLVIMGGTFAPYGGHNIIEPVSFGKPVIVGPYYSNIRNEVDGLEEKKAVIKVKDSDELLKVLKSLVDKKNELQEVGKRAKEWFDSKRGVTQRICPEILIYLQKGRGDQ